MDVWMKGAERLHPSTQHVGGLPMLHNVSRHACTWHRTVGNDFAGNVKVLVHEAFEPTMLWDPWSGEIGQFFPADRGAYALAHIGNPPTNTHGIIHVQIEVVDHGRDTMITDTPMKNGDKLMHFLLQLGIPETLPAGPMLAKGHHKSVTSAVWAKSGHFGHCHAPSGNDHTDPFPMDFTKLWVGKKPAPKPHIDPPPGDPSGALVPTPTTDPEEEMKNRMVKGSGPKVFVTDEIHCRHVEEETERDMLVKRLGPVESVPDWYLTRLVDVTHSGH